MTRISRFGRVIAVAALVLAPAAAQAQAPISTGKAGGVNDPNWQVSTNGGSTFFQAFVVGAAFAPIPPWQANSVGFYQWISAETDASTGVNPSNYIFKTTFDLTGFDPTSVSLLFLCALDNSGSYNLNGGGNVSGCGVFGFGGSQTLSSGFVSGINTLAFNVTGDGTTDGLLVNVTGFSASPIGSVIPEPSTVALVATGLLGVLGAVWLRRRRSDERAA